MSDDVLTDLEPIIDRAEAADAAADESPWKTDGERNRIYKPRTDVLVELMTVPLSDTENTSQTGRLAKTLDAYMAYELRRAKFESFEVWPRNRAPRVFSKELEAVTSKLDRLNRWLADQDAAADKVAKKQEDKGDMLAVAAADKRLADFNAKAKRDHARRLTTYQRQLAKYNSGDQKKEPVPPVEPELRTERVPATHNLMPSLREVITAAAGSIPQINNQNILGRFYVKQVDVVVGAWDRGPDVLISGKTMWSSFGNNAKNRYEETLGEATNLRERYPLAAMGYAFLLNDDILEKPGAFARLQDLMLRTRKPYGPYDATMLLLATWDSTTKQLLLRDPLDHPGTSTQQPPVDLSASRFFTDLLTAVIRNTPEGKHDRLRELHHGTPPPGGTPDLEADAAADDDDD